MRNDDSLELRVMGYNVYGCVDANRKVNLQKIIKIIKQSDPDIIALQEVDDETPSSANRNQARIIGECQTWIVGLPKNRKLFKRYTNGEPVRGWI